MEFFKKLLKNQKKKSAKNQIFIDHSGSSKYGKIVKKLLKNQNKKSDKTTVEEHSGSSKYGKIHTKYENKIK